MKDTVKKRTTTRTRVHNVRHGERKKINKITEKSIASLRKWSIVFVRNQQIYSQ
jgi:hypothetical protein